jgi:hypothetical protein
MVSAADVRISEYFANHMDQYLHKLCVKLYELLYLLTETGRSDNKNDQYGNKLSKLPNLSILVQILCLFNNDLAIKRTGNACKKHQ